MDENTYLDIGGKTMVIDLEELKTLVQITPTDSKNKEKDDDTEIDDGGNLIDVTKWEVVKYMIDVIMTTETELDQMMGFQELHKLPIPFKISFNTLINYNILKEL